MSGVFRSRRSVVASKTEMVPGMLSGPPPATTSRRARLATDRSVMPCRGRPSVRRTRPVRADKTFTLASESVQALAVGVKVGPPPLHAHPTPLLEA